MTSILLPNLPWIRRLACGLALLSPGLAVLLPAAEPATLEERLRRLEQKVEVLEQENTDLRKQLGKPASTVPVTAAGTENKLVIGGFLHAQAEFGRAPDNRWSGVRDRFFFRRARLYVAGNFAEDFDFKAEVDLQGNTISAGTGQLVRANEVFLNWHKFDFANVRFGQIKPAYSAEALSSDPKLVAVERSLSNDRLADGRQLGMSVGGEVLGKRASYLLVVGNGNGSNVSGNDNSKFQKSARVAVTPVATKQDKVVLGVDGLWSDDVAITKSDLGLTGNLFTGRREMSGVDAVWTHGPAEFSGELLHGVFKPVNRVPAAKFDAEGWHLTATYFLLPNQLQAVVRRESFDPNTAVSGNTVNTWLFGLNYFIKGDNLKLSVDYLDGHVPGSTTDGGRIITRMQVLF
jgi:phosphate-selective porin OprO and OprP